jgi:hypothetical protein
MLNKRQTDRVEATGFYDYFAALFGLMGYERGWVTPRGNVQYTRMLSKVSEAGPLLPQFLKLRLGKDDPRPAPKSTPGDPRQRFKEFLEWGREHRSRGWRVSLVEFSKSTKETSGGITWKVRKDLLVGPTNSCSWFFAWPPKSFLRRDWKRLEKEDFFAETAGQLAKIGQKGRWRPGLFSDPDRLAAEFWKPEHDPKVSRMDFKALLDWKLPNS